MERKQGVYEKYIKRTLDILCSVLIIFLFWWLYILVAVLVRFNLGKPVFFTQERVGKNEKIFKIYKFRTMTDKRNESGELLSDKKRLLPFGKWLRSTSLDEIPEVLNILKGDMSFIGPRPLVIQYLPYYSENERHRHDVLPGLSGLAQVNGRNSMNWEEKFSYDLEYASKITFWGDFRIFFLTVKTVLKKNDIGVRGIDAPLDFDKYRKKQMER